MVYLVVSEGASIFPTDSYLEPYEQNEGLPTSLLCFSKDFVFVGR